jgi:hypothetical protein
MYVQAASINYDAGKRFLMKMVLAGWVTKGQVMNTDPMAGMGDMSKMFGGQQQAQPGQGGMPAIPGLDPNMLRKMLGQ